MAAPAHEWSTVLTVLSQAPGINTEVLRPGRNNFSGYGTINLPGRQMAHKLHELCDNTSW